MLESQESFEAQEVCRQSQDSGSRVGLFRKLLRLRPGHLCPLQAGRTSVPPVFIAFLLFEAHDVGLNG